MKKQKRNTTKIGDRLPVADNLERLLGSLFGAERIRVRPASFSDDSVRYEVDEDTNEWVRVS
jgi:hypothetical protein